MFPIIIDPESGIVRSEFQQWMEGRGIDTRMVWTGNVDPPADAAGQGRTGCPRAGCPTPTASWSGGSILPNNHSLTDDDCAYIGETAEAFLTEKGLI